MRFAVCLGVFFFAASAVLAAGDDYSIMKPERSGRGTMWEPWLAPRYKSPRGTKKRVVTPPPTPDEPRRIPQMPPPLVSPRTGQALPNIAPAVPGSGRGGVETFQDRAARCVHQSGSYGAGTGYVGACINQ